MSAASSGGSPMAVSTMMSVTRPAWGTPAAPILAKVAVILEEGKKERRERIKFHTNIMHSSTLDHMDVYKKGQKYQIPLLWVIIQWINRIVHSIGLQIVFKQFCVIINKNCYIAKYPTVAKYNVSLKILLTYATSSILSNPRELSLAWAMKTAATAS